MGWGVNCINRCFEICGGIEGWSWSLIGLVLSTAVVVAENFWCGSRIDDVDGLGLVWTERNVKWARTRWAWIYRAWDIRAQMCMVKRSKVQTHSSPRFRNWPGTGKREIGNKLPLPFSFLWPSLFRTLARRIFPLPQETQSLWTSQRYNGRHLVYLARACSVRRGHRSIQNQICT